MINTCWEQVFSSTFSESGLTSENDKVDPNEHWTLEERSPCWLMQQYCQTWAQWDPFLITKPVPEPTSRVWKMLQVNHTIKKSIRQSPLSGCDILYLQRKPWEIHPYCVDCAGVRSVAGLIAERGPGTTVFTWPATPATASIHFDLCSSPMQQLTHLVCFGWAMQHSSLWRAI